MQRRHFGYMASTNILLLTRNMFHRQCPAIHQGISLATTWIFVAKVYTGGGHFTSNMTGLWFPKLRRVSLATIWIGDIFTDSGLENFISLHCFFVWQNAVLRSLMLPSRTLSTCNYQQETCRRLDPLTFHPGSVGAAKFCFSPTLCKWLRLLEERGFPSVV